jgi:hypothetical protein
MLGSTKMSTTVNERVGEAAETIKFEFMHDDNDGHTAFFEGRLAERPPLLHESGVESGLHTYR